MSFLESVEKARAFLERNGRVSLRALQREFELDDEALDDLVEELVDVQQVAAREGKVLSWIGAVPPESSASGPEERAIPEASSEPVEAPQATEAELRQITVLFCDLVDSTRLAYRLDPEDWREIVRQYQRTCSNVVERFDGHVAQYLGDGVLVYFGYPLAHEDDAIRALHVAMRIRDEVFALNPRLAERLPLVAEHPLQVRIGVHTGAVVVGTAGAGEKRDQLALGGTTHIAARLEALAEPGTVVLSDATRQLVRGAFLLEDLGEQSLKGIPQPVSVHRAVRTLGVQSRLNFGSGPLVGREEQMALLMDRWQEAREGRGQVVLLSGEAGMGKSRLVQALRERVADQPHTWQEYHASRYHQNSALYPIAEFLERVLIFTENDTPDERIGKLARGLDVSGLPVPEVLPLIAPLLSLPATAAYPPPELSPEAQRRKSLQLLSAWCLTVAELQPLILIAEDLHWADPTTVELVGMMVEQAPTTSILMVMTYRPGFQPPWAGRSDTAHFTLNALSRRQVRQMIDGLAGGKALPAEVMDEVVSKTDGVPLFVEELTKTVLESGLLRLRDGNYELAGPLPPLAIPSTLQDSLMARLDRLGTTKEVVQLGAVLGREFSHELLAAVSSLDPETLEGALDRLVGTELLYQRGVRPRATYQFKHSLIQDTAYQSLLKSMRQQYHARAAQALLEHSPETVESQPELLARHYTEAGLTDLAMRYWQLAGQRAVERSAYAEAIRQLTIGVELVERLPETRERAQQELLLQLALGQALAVTQGYGAPEVEQAYVRARDLCKGVGEAPQLFQALLGLHSTCLVRAEHDRAGELADELLRLALSAGDPWHLFMGHRAKGDSSFWRGEFCRAREQLEEAIRLYDPQECRTHAHLWASADPGVWALSYLSMALAALGYPDQALAKSREALALTRELSHPFSEATALMFVVRARWVRGEPQATLEGAEALIALSTEHGFTLWAGMGTFIRAWALFNLGRLQEGLGGMRAVVQALRATGTVLHSPSMLVNLAEAYQKAGKAEEGLALIEDAQSSVTETGEREYEAEVHRVKGELLLARQPSDRAEAEASLREAHNVARRQSAKSFELRAATSLARLWNQQGRKDEARELLAPVYDWFTEGFETRDLKEAKALLDELG